MAARRVKLCRPWRHAGWSCRDPFPSSAFWTRPPAALRSTAFAPRPSSAAPRSRPDGPLLQRAERLLLLAARRRQRRSPPGRAEPELHALSHRSGPSAPRSPDTLTPPGQARRRPRGSGRAAGGESRGRTGRGGTVCMEWASVRFDRNPCGWNRLASTDPAHYRAPNCCVFVTACLSSYGQLAHRAFRRPKLANIRRPPVVIPVTPPRKSATERANRFPVVLIGHGGPCI